MTEIIKAAQARKDAEKRREEISEDALNRLKTNINEQVQAAINRGEFQTAFKTKKGYKSILEIREHLTPLLSEYKDVKITACPDRTMVWIEMAW